MRKIAWLTATILLLAQAAGAAEPTFKYAIKEELKKPQGEEWKVQIQGGLIYATGNTRSFTGSGTATLGYRRFRNRFGLEGGGLYGRSQVYGPSPNAGDVLGPGDIVTTTTVTAESWYVRGRYDRFLTDNNSLFASAGASHDLLAGRDIAGNVQAGYNRLIIKDQKNELSGEVGYDYTYLRFVTPAGSSTHIHSARLFVGYIASLTTDTSFNASLEALFNLNPEDRPGGRRLSAFDDTRLVGKTALTTRLFKNISFRAGFSVRYVRSPAPRPEPPGRTYAPGFIPLADTTDTLTELSLIVNFI